MHITQTGLSAVSEALAFALDERRTCLSDREWRFRLRGYGYDIRHTARGRMLTQVTSGRDLGLIDG
ncbi:hypothetical protein [Sinisalibacter lacisalsi]|uniref:Uncharacterized protein n=1 Tax=Sinisalibacter lacisalsi TaxID=1526570 RepID=A0ABQ1QM97_9RHOB|nr:hypothetical protein [Sinisalibacter lacisalsi]GGD30580.1 hypothetical protein GCM10011358_13280 [Sinisalibacter lacisalsi]